jgi:hypothetical protein
MSKPAAESIYVAQVAFGDSDSVGYLLWANAPSSEDARQSLTASLAEGDRLLEIQELETLLAPWRERIANGEQVGIGFKYESEDSGPILISRQPSEQEIDEDPQVERSGEALLIAFGYRPAWDLVLPWTTHAQARNLAAELGLELSIS